MSSVKDEIEQKQKEIQKLTRMLEQYPDLVKEVNRWKTVFFCSKTVNSTAVDVDFGHSCGCCPDSPLGVFVYVIVDGERVYGIPHRLYIGEKGYDGFDRFDDNWENSCREYGMNEIAIQKIRDYAEEQKKQSQEYESYSEEEEYEE